MTRATVPAWPSSRPESADGINDLLGQRCCGCWILPRVQIAVWSARRFVDSGEKPEFIRTCEVKSVSCRLRNSVKSLKNKSSRRFLRGFARSQVVAKSYNLVPQTVGNWVRIWRKQHPDPSMVEASSDQVAENKRLQAELREATTGDRVQR